MTSVNFLHSFSQLSHLGDGSLDVGRRTEAADGCHSSELIRPPHCNRGRIYFTSAWEWPVTLWSGRWTSEGKVVGSIPVVYM